MIIRRRILFFLLLLYVTAEAFGDYCLQFDECVQQFFKQKIKEAQCYYPIVLENMGKGIEYYKSNAWDLKDHILTQMEVGFNQHNDRDLVDCWKMGYYLLYLQDHKIFLSKEETSIIKKVLYIMKAMISTEGQSEDKLAFDRLHDQLEMDKILTEVKKSSKSILKWISSFMKR